MPMVDREKTTALPRANDGKGPLTDWRTGVYRTEPLNVCGNRLVPGSLLGLALCSAFAGALGRVVGPVPLGVLGLGLTRDRLRENVCPAAGAALPLGHDRHLADALFHFLARLEGHDILRLDLDLRAGSGVTRFAGLAPF